MTTDPSVLVVGAGPTGLTLAAELASAGVRCRVVDKRSAPMPTSRAFGLMPRTMEMLDMRGQVEAFVEAGSPCARAPLGDQRGHLDYTQLDSPFPYILVLPQQRSEALLETWAIKAGAEVRREITVTDLRQDGDGVVVDLVGPSGTWSERADYVVGCDGVHSTVRAAVGIPFSGRDYPQSLVIADVRLRRPPPSEVYARIGRRGMVALYPFGDGTFRLIVLDRRRMSVPVATPLTIEELEDSVLGITGLGFGVHDPLWLSRYRSAQKHAHAYRKGRVLLAGDAAHTHIPSGGQGLQVGMQDAMNLAWKLTAELAGWAPPWLLDSYERERLPIATATLRKTDLAFRFETSNSPAAQLVRWSITRSMHVRPLQVPVMREFAGLTLRYPRPRAAHRSVGTRMPDVTIRRADGGTSRLHELLRDRRFVLIDASADALAAAAVEAGWADRVVAVPGRVTERSGLPDVVLVRPDGYVAWADSPVHGIAARRALREWCGTPATNGEGD